MERDKRAGCHRLSVSEFTGEEITLMNPLPLRYGTAGQFGLSSEKILSDRAAILTERSSKYTEPVISYIKRRCPLRNHIQGSGYGDHTSGQHVRL